MYTDNSRLPIIFICRAKFAVFVYLIRVAFCKIDNSKEGIYKRLAERTKYVNDNRRGYVYIQYIYIRAEVVEISGLYIVADEIKSCANL